MGSLSEFIVHAILDGSFDEDYYKQRIVMDYRKA